MQNNQSANLSRWSLRFCWASWGLAAPSFAALEMVDFRIFSLSDRLRLERETAQEYNLIAFQIYCKEETQTDADYHPIGYPIPGRGGLEAGAVYFSEVRDLQPGVSYCFRLQEITSDDEPGEVFEICGYGIRVTPTATVTPTPTETEDAHAHHHPK